jgi:hypothetical protein
MKKKNEGEFSNYFDDAKSFENSSTRMHASYASHEGGGGSGGSSEAATVPLQLINDDDIPLRRAFEDLVQFDEKNFVSHQHKFNAGMLRFILFLLFHLC